MEQIGSSKLTAAREAVDQAMQALARESQRLEAAEAEIAALSKDVLTADPDGDPKGFARAASAKDAARARLEALRERVAAAQEGVEEAERVTAEAAEETTRAQLAALDAEILAKDAELSREVRNIADRLVAGVRELQTLEARANDLAKSLPLPPGASYFVAPTRGTWAGAIPTPIDVLKAGMRRLEG